MSDQVNLNPENVYSENTSNQLSPGSIPNRPNVNHQAVSHSRGNFDTSWIKNHISRDNLPRLFRKKLTHFLDVLLTYDVKKGYEPKKRMLKDSSLKRSTHYIEPQSGLVTQSKEVGQTDVKEINASQENVEGRIETDKKSTGKIRLEESQENVERRIETDKKSTGKIRLEEYITETWEKYRKCYEHLGEKNPFANEPPSPEFLLKNYSLLGKYQKSSPNEERKNNGFDHRGEKVIPSQSVDQNLDIISDQNNVTTNISDENNALDSTEPSLEHEAEAEAEELDYQSESNSETESIINNDGPIIPIENETLIADDVNEIQTSGNKRSGCTEDYLTEGFNEYDEISYYKSKEKSLKAAGSYIGAQTTKSSVTSTTDTKLNEIEFQKPEKGNIAFRKSSNKKVQKQLVKPSMYKPLRPLVNPYLVSPFGSAAMMPPQNPIYPFQPPGMPFNYWMAKQPFNQFNMFPYGYPWQSFPFLNPYFPPYYQQNMASTPYVGSPFFSPDNISPPSPLGPSTPSSQGMSNVPSKEFTAASRYGTGNASSSIGVPVNELEESKANYSQPKRGSKPHQSQYQKHDFNYPYTGHHDHHQNIYHRHGLNNVINQSYQPYKSDQKFSPEHEINNSSDPHRHGRQFTHLFNPGDMRQNLVPSWYNSRSSQSTLPSSEFKMQGRVPPAASNDLWPRDQSNLVQNRHISHSYYGSPPPTAIPHPQQRMNDQTHQLSTTTNGYERVRSNTEFPVHNPGKQSLAVPTSDHSWFSDPPQNVHGNYPPHNYNLPAPL